MALLKSGTAAGVVSTEQFLSPARPGHLSEVELAVRRTLRRRGARGIILGTSANQEVRGDHMIQYSSALLAVLLVIDGSFAFAQGPPPGGGVSAPRTPEGITMGYMSQGDVKGLADFLDSTRLLERKDLVPKAVATRRSTAMLKALAIPCQLTDAQHVAAGKSMTGGKSVDVGM